MLNALKLIFKSNYILFKVVRIPLIAMGYFKKKSKAKVDDFWEQRIETTLLSPDNKSIARVSDAGEIKKDTQVMHNGIKIHVGSYYGDGITSLLYRNKGVHEPQEEKVFCEVLEYLPANATMLELGAFWGFYSMSFQRKIKFGSNYLIEPDRHSLLSGKHNFKLNNFKGNFFNYYISDHPSSTNTPTITVDQFLKNNKIPRLNILHSDIQGFELKMLHGSADHLKAGKIDYFFISTHSNELHEACKQYLESFDYTILCDANLDETYSWDGLVVAKNKHAKGPLFLEIQKK